NAGAIAKLQIPLSGESAAPGSVSGKIGSPNAQTAGITITNGIVVRAVDANWNLISTATTNITISSSDTNAVASDDNGATAGNMTLSGGTRTLTNFTFKTAGIRTITASDVGGVLTPNTSANVTVNLGAVSKLQVL